MIKTVDTKALYAHLQNLHGRLITQVNAFDNIIYALIVAALCVLLILPIWQIEYLPLGDLPDHAAQLRVILDYSEYREDFRIQWFTPYLVGYALTLLFATFLSIPMALKVVLTISLIAMPVSLAWLIRLLKGNKYWLIACFPIFYHYAFYWGFLSYAVAMPIAFFSIAYITYLAQRQMQLRDRLALFLVGVLLFFSHAMAWMMVAVLAPLIYWQFGTLRSAWRSSLPIYLAMPVVLLWLSKSDTAGGGPEVGQIIEHYYRRVSDNIGYLIDQVQLRSEQDEHWPRFKEMWSLAIGRPASLDYCFLTLWLMIWPLCTGGRLKLNPKRWLPLATVIATYMLVPYWILDTAYVYLRFAVFLLPTYFFVLAGSPNAGSTTAGTALRNPKSFLLACSAPVIVVTILWTNIQTFRAFGENDRQFAHVLQAIEPGKQVLALVHEHHSPFRFSAAYLHFGGWVQAEKGGLTLMNFSFDPHADNIPVRYRSKPWPVPGTWDAQKFDWTEHQGERYDYYLVRANEEKRNTIDPSGRKITLVSHDGVWWLYKRVSGGEPDADPASAAAPW